MLEDLIKALGLGPTLPVATGIPDGKEAAMSSVPVVREIPQVSPTEVPVVQPTVDQTPPPISSLAAMANGGGVETPYQIPDWLKVDAAPEYTGAVFNPNPEAPTAEDLSNEEAMLNREKVFEAPGVKELVSAADAVDPNTLNLKPEDDSQVKEVGTKATKLIEQGEDPKTVMQMAGDALGSLFDDDAIKQALIYYTGARLMGYSASGSGMAAGNLLQRGWAAQNKNATDQAEADRNTDLAALKARTPDRSKTVQMFDTDSKKIIEVNMAPNGDAYPPGSEKGFNAASAGLVTYRPATHKTFNDIDNDMVTYTNKAMNDALASLKDEEIYPNAEYTKGLFEDGLAVSQLVQHATRRLKDSGVDYDTPAFRNALSNTIKSEVLKVAKGGEAVDNETMTKDLIGTVESNWLKASLEGAVPKFVLGKYTKWGDDGKGVTYDKDFELPREDQTRLFDTASGINRQFLDYYTEKNPKNKAKIRKTITQTNTISNLSKVFTTNVMSDKKAATHWQQVADKSNPPTNAFSAWLQSEKSDTAMHPLNYKGLNNSSVKSKAEDMYESQLKD